MILDRSSCKESLGNYHRGRKKGHIWNQVFFHHWSQEFKLFSVIHIRQEIITNNFSIVHHHAQRNLGMHNGIQLRKWLWCGTEDALHFKGKTRSSFPGKGNTGAYVLWSSLQGVPLTPYTLVLHCPSLQLSWYPWWSCLNYINQNPLCA